MLLKLTKCLFFALIFISQAKTAENEKTGPLGYLKSHFSLSYHGEYYFTRKDVLSANEDDHDLQDLRIMHNPTITYKPIANLRILATSEFKYTDAESKGTFINRHFRSLVLITRENILTEKENKIQVNAGIGRRIFDRNHGKASSYGNYRANTTISKKFSETASGSLYLQYLLNDPVRSKITASTWKHGLEVIPSLTFQLTEKISYFFNDDIVINKPWHSNDNHNIDISHEMNIGVLSYQFNDKNSAYFQIKYLHSSTSPFLDENPKDDWMEYYLGHTHSFTPNITLTAELGTRFISPRDGRSFLAKEARFPELAFYFDASL